MGNEAPLEPYVARLSSELEAITAAVLALLDLSEIQYVNPNTRYSDMLFVGAADWGWARSSEAASSAQMALRGWYEEWFARFKLLFPRPTPEIEETIADADKFVRGWIVRDGTFDHTIPSTIEKAKEVAASNLTAFVDLLRLAGADGDAMARLVPDTNALLRNPAVEDYGASLGLTAYEVHIFPTVLAEIDDLKDRGRTTDVREKAEAVVRRLKGLRDRGRLSQGVKVAGQVYLRLESREVKAPSVLSWLDADVPDDRIIAAALRLQSDHPAGVVVLITADMNLQNKAEAVGLPYSDPPTARVASA
jgi:hypothetical protein